MTKHKRPFRTRPATCSGLVIHFLREQAPGFKLGQSLLAELIGKSHRSVPARMDAAVSAGVLTKSPSSDGFVSYALAEGLVFEDPSPGQPMLIINHTVDATTVIRQSVCKASERPPIRPARPMSIFHIAA
jgi:hypothetical protein